MVEASGNEAGEGGQLIVGCALLPKKVSRYLTPRMVQVASEAGISLRQIDWQAPLEPQGPFDVIIHKLRPDADWERALAAYVSAHPGCCVVDRLDRIQQLHNRATMLTPLQGAGITLSQPLSPAQAAAGAAPQCVVVQAPLQVEIPEGASEAQAAAALAAAGLCPPLLCKPLWTDGREGSHGLAVLHDLEALGRLLRGGVASEFKPPLVVQQFVEHGGVLFKVYVLGSQTVVTARPSLGETALDAEQGVQQLPRISCVSVFGKQQQQQQQQQVAAGAGAPAPTSPGCAQQAHVQQRAQQQAPPASPPSLAAVAAAWKPPPCKGRMHPPAWVTSALAARLRQELGMQLFNFDLLVPEQQGGLCWEQQGERCREEPGQPEQQPQQPQQRQPTSLLVCDVNYFPGVDKIPCFEQRFAAFLREASQMGAGAAPAAAAAVPAAAAAAAGVLGPAAAAGGAERRGKQAAPKGALAAATSTKLAAPQQQQLPPALAAAASSPDSAVLHRSSSSGGGSRRHSSGGGGGAPATATPHASSNPGCLSCSPQLEVAGC